MEHEEYLVTTVEETEGGAHGPVNLLINPRVIEARNADVAADIYMTNLTEAEGRFKAGTMVHVIKYDLSAAYTIEPRLVEE